MGSASTIGPTEFESLEPRLLLSTTIFYETFEGSFPGPWTTNVSQGRRWGQAMSMSYGGWYSAHCAVTQYGTETNNYVDNMLTTLSRTVDLSGYDAATLSFKTYLNCEYGYDGLTVTVNGTPTGGMGTGSSGDWFQVDIDLGAWCGDDNLTLAFQFSSDYTGIPYGYSGAWIDNILLLAEAAPPPTDTDDQLAEATTVWTIPSTFNGEITPETDVDMVRFTAFPGANVGLDLDRLSGDLDGYLRIFDDAGNELAFNDDAYAPDGDSGPDTDAFIEFTCGDSFWYYVGISAAGNTDYDPVTGEGDAPGGSTGQYALSITLIPDADLRLASYGLQLPGGALLTGPNAAGLGYTIVNDGPRTLQASGCAIDILLSTDPTITADDTLIGTYELPLSLAAGQSASDSVTLTVDVPAAVSSGVYYVGGHVRSTAGIDDPDDGNNWLAGPAVQVVRLVSPGDADGDGDVDLDDFMALKQNFGTATDATWAMGNFDDDGDVDLDDFMLLKQHFGTAADAAPVVRADTAVADAVEPPARRLRRRLARRAPRDLATDTSVFDLLETARLAPPRR